jgi:hypothetical protein
MEQCSGSYGNRIHEMMNAAFYVRLKPRRLVDLRDEHSVLLQQWSTVGSRASSLRGRKVRTEICILLTLHSSTLTLLLLSFILSIGDLKVSESKFMQCSGVFSAVV